MADTTTAMIKGEEWEAAAAVEETDAFEGEGGDFPNMLFVPQRRSEPVVEAREFVTFICMLMLFSHTVIAQQFAIDQRVNDAMQSVANIICLQKMSTFEDYQHCWQDSGGIYDQLSSWTASAETCLAEQGPVGFDLQEQKEAVMIGIPFIYQQRQTIPVGQGGFNGSEACAWSPNTDARGGLYACYTHTISKIATQDFGPTQEVFALSSEQARGVMNGTFAGRDADEYYGWSPSSWFSREETVRLGLNYVIYLPGMKRFATAHITVYFDEAGQAKLETRDFSTYAPFVLDTNRFSAVLEIGFYVVNVYYLFMELMEVWDCVCMSELLLPFEVLTGAMTLSLLEIQYFHARTSEVYDPRDPKTGAAFTFPDVDDLEEHLNTKIKPEQKTIKRLQKLLRKEKEKIMEKDENIEQQEKDGFIVEMEKLQIDLMTADEILHAEEFVADTAAILQLAVMWWNKWSMDFPPNALAQLADDPTVEEDGKDAFRSINWIQIAELYIGWVDTVCLGKNSKVQTDGRAPTARTNRFLKEDQFGKQQMTHQHKRFAQLQRYADYLQMLRDVLSLHTTLTQARGIKYWNGPRIDLSNTIERSFQGMIQKYNETGKTLKMQMEDFPDEIQAGFHEPNPTKAETIKVRAEAIQRELQGAISTCGTLGFYFPGSPMWELQRRLRECGEYERSDSFWLSLRPLATIPGVGSGTVDYNSLQMYLDADLVDKDPRFQSTQYRGTAVGKTEQKRSTKPKKKRMSRAKKDNEESLMTMVNPMQQLGDDGKSSESSSDDSDNDEDEGTGVAIKPSIAEEISGKKKADAEMIFIGTRGWRSWIPESARHLVTYDGQFMPNNTNDISGCCKSNNSLYIAGLWFYNGLKIYLDDYWNCMELWLYTFFMVALYCKVQMLLSGDTLKQELIDVQSGVNPAGAMPTMQGDYQFYNNLYLFTVIPNAFIMWIKLFKCTLRVQTPANFLYGRIADVAGISDCFHPRYTEQVC